MHTETVKVAFVNQPAAGRKTGSIKSEAGNYYNVEPHALALFEKGGTYEIQYTTRDWQGKTYRDFKAMAGASPGNAKAVASASCKSEEMAVMGIIGRALQGSGTVPDEETLTIMMQAVRHAWRTTFGD